jgi:hypothetical protein
MIKKKFHLNTENLSCYSVILSKKNRAIFLEDCIVLNFAAISLQSIAISFFELFKS